MSRIIVQLCKSEKITPSELILLFMIVNNSKIKSNEIFTNEQAIEVVNGLKRKFFIDDKLKATDKGKRLIVDYENQISNEEKKPNVKQVNAIINEKEIESYVDEYRNLFKGLKPGSMGDKKACVKKLVQFYKEYAEYANKDLILSATKRYINSLNNYTYLKQADYFIFKQDHTKIDKSMLASYCEEIEMGAEEEDRITFKNTKMV